MITRRYENFDFAVSEYENCGFTLQFQADLSALPCGVIAELPGVFTLRKRIAGAADETNADKEFTLDQHYPAGAAVLEATVFLTDPAHPEWTEIRVGTADFPQGNAEWHLHTDMVSLKLICNGREKDINYLYGALPQASGELMSAVPAKLSMPALKPAVTEQFTDTPDSIQYYKPEGAWVGDVVPFYHNGTLHMFYLLDRRHHNSKFKTGAHYFAHLSSRDLIRWQEHEPATVIRHQNETFGTGTPFFFEGKYYFALGLHTGRYLDGGTLLNRMDGGSGNMSFEPGGSWSDAQKNGPEITGVYPAEIGENDIPRGAVLYQSEDCIHFEPMNIQTHFCENPSVYPDKNGGLLMYANGTWKTAALDQKWVPVRPDFPPDGRASLMRNTLECPSCFEWQGRYYMLVGMTGMYASDTPDFTEFEDLSADGRDLYDGLLVPMAVPFGADRRILAGWLFPFGSYMVVRELAQRPNGIPGLKWCPELMPEIKEESELEIAENTLDAQVPEYVCYEFDLDLNKTGRIALNFMPEKSGDAAQFILDAAADSMQMDTLKNESEFNELLPTTRDVIAAHREELTIFKELPMETKYKCHVFSRNFRLDNLCLPDGAASLRIMLKYDPRMPGTLIDVEAAGYRTMISLRMDMRVARINVLKDGVAEIRKITRNVF